MQIALVGIGKIAVDQHVPAITESPDWELSATVSRRGEVPGVASYTDFDQMLEERNDIRVVSLCLPPVPRFEYAAKAIRAGRHVMLEKPPGATLSECHTLQDMARAARVSLYATWHSRYAEKVPAAKAWLKGKSLHRVSITWREDVRRWHPGQDWVFEAGGLGVFDPGINALSILTEILPDPIHLIEAELRFPENRDTPIAASGRFYHAGGADVTFDLDWQESGTPTWCIEVLTDEGLLRLENGGDKLSVNGQDDGSSPDASGEYSLLYAHMAALVARGGIDVDLSPMCHVADAFTLGKRIVVAPFEW